MTTRVHTTRKRAIELEHGDVCQGPREFVDMGIVQSTVVVDAGVQINWIGGTLTTVPEHYELAVVPGNRTRRAVVRGGTPAAIAPYLPANYRVAGTQPDDGVLIEGVDLHGWTLTDYVLPRLASGMIFGSEVTT